MLICIVRCFLVFAGQACLLPGQEQGCRKSDGSHAFSSPSLARSSRTLTPTHTQQKNPAGAGLDFNEAKEVNSNDTIKGPRTVRQGPSRF